MESLYGFRSIHGANCTVGLDIEMTRHREEVEEEKWWSCGGGVAVRRLWFRRGGVAVVVQQRWFSSSSKPWCSSGGSVVVVFGVFGWFWGCGDNSFLVNMENYNDPPVALTLRSKLSLIKVIRKKIRSTVGKYYLGKSGCFGWLLDIDESH
ncbi:hypothetical protein Tco_0580951 [Tanacetum coccineum]